MRTPRGSLLRASSSPQKTRLKSYPKSWQYLRWSIFLLYCYASFAPSGPVWGLHFLAYLPIAPRCLMLGLAAFLLLPTVQTWVSKILLGYYSKHKVLGVHWVLTGLISVLGFFVFQMFPSQSEASNVLSIAPSAAGGSHWSWIVALFSPHIMHSRDALMVGICESLSHSLSIPIEFIPRLISACSGALFIYLWLVYVQKVSTGVLRLVLASLGLFTGAIQIFFGHVENYSFAVLASTAFLFCLYFYLYEKTSNTIFVLSYIFALKAHPIALLFLPALVLAVMYRYRAKVSWFDSTFTWRASLVRVVLPFVAIGIVLSLLPVGLEFERLFLGSVPSPIALHRYSFLSPVYFANFVNVLFLIAGPIIVLLLTLLIFNRKEVVWSCPIVIVFAVAALFPLIFFIALNPTLSPVQDWDVYALLFAPLLFFASVIMTHSTVRDYVPSWVIFPLVFGVIFTASMVSVNASPRALHQREQDVASYRNSYGGYQANEMAQFSSDCASRGNYLDAIRWGEAAVDSDPMNTRYAENLAVCYLEGKRIGDASNMLESLYAKAIANDTVNMSQPILADAIGRLSQHFESHGDDVAASLWAARAVQIEPHSTEYLLNLASCYLVEKRVQEGLATLGLIPKDSLSPDLVTEIESANNSLFAADRATRQPANTASHLRNDAIDSVLAYIAYSRALH